MRVQYWGSKNVSFIFCFIQNLQGKINPPCSPRFLNQILRYIYLWSKWVIVPRREPLTTHAMESNQEELGLWHKMTEILRWVLATDVHMWSAVDYVGTFHLLYINGLWAGFTKLRYATSSHSIMQQAFLFSEVWHSKLWDFWEKWFWAVRQIDNNFSTSTLFHSTSLQSP